MEHSLEYIVFFSTTFFGGILGYFLRLIIENRMAVDRIKIGIEITNFNRAASSFRAAFAPAQGKIYLTTHSNSATDLSDFFDSEFISQSAAIENFRPFVSDNIAYQQAWEDYRKTIYDDDKLTPRERWMINMIQNEDDDNGEIFLEVIENKINNILHFANDKIK